MTKEAMGYGRIEALADGGYYRGNGILACSKNGGAAYVPKTYTPNNQAEGLYLKRDFGYIATDDEFEWPAGERAIFRFSREEGGKLIRRYWSSACIHSDMKQQCNTSKYRRISRQTYKTGQYRNEFIHPGLQLKKGNQYPGDGAAVDCYGPVIALSDKL